VPSRPRFERCWSRLDRGWSHFSRISSDELRIWSLTHYNRCSLTSLPVPPLIRKTLVRFTVYSCICLKIGNRLLRHPDQVPTHNPPPAFVFVLKHRFIAFLTRPPRTAASCPPLNLPAELSWLVSRNDRQQLTQENRASTHRTATNGTPSAAQWVAGPALVGWAC